MHYSMFSRSNYPRDLLRLLSALNGCGQSKMVSLNRKCLQQCLELSLYSNAIWTPAPSFSRATNPMGPLRILPARLNCESKSRVLWCTYSLWVVHGTATGIVYVFWVQQSKGSILWRVSDHTTKLNFSAKLNLQKIVNADTHFNQQITNG